MAAGRDSLIGHSQQEDRALTYPAAAVLAKRGIPFIFATGYGSGGLKEAYSDRPTLQKPFDTEALGQAIQRACPIPTRR